MDPVFLVLQPKNHHLYGCFNIGMYTPAKKDYPSIGALDAFFGLKTDFNNKKA